MIDSVPCPNGDKPSCPYCAGTGRATTAAALRWEHWLTGLAPRPYHYAHVIAWRKEQCRKVTRAKLHPPESMAA